VLKTCTSIYKIVDKNISLVKVKKKMRERDRDPGETGGCRRRGLNRRMDRWMDGWVGVVLLGL